MGKFPLNKKLCHAGGLPYYLQGFGGPGPITLTWSPTPNFTHPLSGFPDYTEMQIDSSVNYTLVVKNSNGDSSIWNYVFEVDTNTIPPHITANEMVLCDSIRLVSNFHLSQDSNDRWFFNGVEILKKSDTIFVHNPGWYSLTNFANCSISKDSILLTSNINFSVNVIPSLNICLGDEVSLQANSSDSLSFTWNLGVINNIPFSPLTTNTYTVIGTDVYGCSATSAKEIIVNPMPIIHANSFDSSLCMGDSTFLFGSGGLSYTWNSGVTNNIPFAPLSTQTYTVVGTDANGCSATSTKEIMVNPLPDIHANASDSTLCIGDTTSLFGSGGLNYTWNFDVMDSVPFTPSHSQTYTVIGTDMNGCADSSSIQINVYPNLAIQANSIDSILCKGDFTTLYGTGGSDYNWNLGVLDNIPFAPDSTQIYTVSITDAHGCATASSIEIIVNQIPTSPTLSYHSDSHEFLSDLTLGTSIVFMNGIEISVANPNQFETQGNGVYQIKFIDVNGCEAWSNRIELDENVRDISVVPNPFTDHLQLSLFINSKEQITYTLFDQLGNKILESSPQEKLDIGQHKIRIDHLDMLSKGVYYLQIVLSEANYVYKLVK